MILPVLDLVILPVLDLVILPVLGRGQRRHRDRGTGSIPDFFQILLDMKKLIGANPRGCNKDQSCKKNVEFGRTI